MGTEMDGTPGYEDNRITIHPEALDGWEDLPPRGYKSQLRDLLLEKTLSFCVDWPDEDAAEIDADDEDYSQYGAIILDPSQPLEETMRAIEGDCVHGEYSRFRKEDEGMDFLLLRVGSAVVLFKPRSGDNEAWMSSLGQSAKNKVSLLGTEVALIIPLDDLVSGIANIGDLE